jgi:hypothetical protein
MSTISEQLELAEHVRTPAGAAYYHLPIGALITRHDRLAEPVSLSAQLGNAIELGWPDDLREAIWETEPRSADDS